jgi:thiamine biosynthesis lipoprotein
MLIQGESQPFYSAQSGKAASPRPGRGRWVIFPVLWLLCFLELISAAPAQLQRYEYSTDAMGGAFSVTLYSASHSNADTAAAAAMAELHRLDQLLSNYRSDSEWAEVNGSAAQHPTKVSQELFDLLSKCLEYSRQSEGAFDISVGPLVKAWGFYNGSGHFANEVAIREALGRTGYANILLDPMNHTIQFARTGVEIDPGGIGKGYAVDRMIDVLRRNNIEQALVSAAGSSIYGLGTPPGQTGWPVSISLPMKTYGDPVKLMLKNESLSISGSTKKFFRVHNQVYGHILDPRTGYPVRGVLMVAVIAPGTLDSEAWTKAFFVNGRRWGTQHIPPGFRVYFCEAGAIHPLCGFLP